MSRVVVVGYGMAGARLADELLARDRGLDVTVLGAEPHQAYNRILLSGVLAGRTREADSALPELRGERLRLRLDAPVTEIDPDARRASTADGAVYPYDALVLATGSRAVVPPVEGLVEPLVFRTLDDCRRIIEQADGARTALVLGGGLLGLEAARGLVQRGLTVTVVHAMGHLMERQLDAGAGAVLCRTLGDLGIEVILNAKAVAALPTAVPSAAGWSGAVPSGAGWPAVGRSGLGGLRLADGRDLRADLLVVACGVQPEVGLARRAGLEVGHGVRVDGALRTSDPSIYALGDCAEVPGGTTGFVAPAWAQARVLADRLTRTDPDARYHPAPTVTRLKAAGIDLATMGESAGNGSGADGPYADDTVTYVDVPGRRYAKLVIRRGRLAGAIMLGDQPAVGAVIQHVDQGTPLPADPRPLLLARPGAGERAGAGTATAESPVLMPDSAVVCRCNAVTKGALTRAWTADGAKDVAAVTRAGTGCGSCRGVIDGILSWLSTVDAPGAEVTAR